MAIWYLRSSIFHVQDNGLRRKCDFRMLPA